MKSSVVELEKTFESQIKEIDQKCNQLNQTLESITELIKEQSAKETRNQEVQTEKGESELFDRNNQNFSYHGDRAK